MCLSCASAQSLFQKFSGLASATRKMSLINALYIVMKSCRFLMVKSQNQRSK